MKTPLEIARQVIADEAAALHEMAGDFGDGRAGAAAFDAILDTIIDASQQVIVSGLGKSGNIAQKVAASLTSTRSAPCKALKSVDLPALTGPHSSTRAGRRA